MRPLTEEARPAAGDVQARAQPVAGFPRRGHRDGRLERNAADPDERVRDDFGFERGLPRILDVRVDAAAAERIREHRAAICRRGQDVGCRGERQPLVDTLHPRPHALARYAAEDQHDLPFVARDHAPAGGRLFDVELDQIAGRQHGLFVSEHGDAERLTHQPLVSRAHRPVANLGRHPRAERRQFRLRLALQRLRLMWIDLEDGRRQQVGIERREPVDKLRARLAPCVFRLIGQTVELPHDRVDAGGELCRP